MIRGWEITKTYRISSNSFRGINFFQVLTDAATKRGRLLLSSVKGKIIEWVIIVKGGQAEANCADTIRGRILNHWQKQTVRTLFEGGH